eukprot:1151267-Pelagomonas_calceolata.AAC.1
MGLPAGPAASQAGPAASQGLCRLSCAQAQGFSDGKELMRSHVLSWCSYLTCTLCHNIAPLPAKLRKPSVACLCSSAHTSPCSRACTSQITHPIAFNILPEEKPSKSDKSDRDKEGKDKEGKDKEESKGEDKDRDGKDKESKDKEGNEETKATAHAAPTHPSALGLSDAEIADGKTWSVRVVVYSGVSPEVLYSEDAKSFQWPKLEPAHCVRALLKVMSCQHHGTQAAQLKVIQPGRSNRACRGGNSSV